MTDGGKGDKRRNENTAAVEANWPKTWDARDVPEVQGDQGSDVEGSEAEAASNEARGH